MINKPLITVIGANPAWQKTLFFREFIPGRVNRAYKEENYSSGKGVNFCRALRCSELGESILLQFAGGINGKRHCDGLDAAGFRHKSVVTAAETRNCITCLDDAGNMSELIGVSEKITGSESDEFIKYLQEVLPETDLLAITGSLPDGSDPELYHRAAELAAKAGIPLLIDALAGVDGVLSRKNLTVLKVNQEEFFKITSCNEIISAHRIAQKRYPGKIFAVTNGADSATLSAAGVLYEYSLPEIKVVSPLGAGDTASAVMSALIAVKTPPEEAFLQALAAASANCMNAVAGEFSPENSRCIAAQIKMESQAL
ncbi:MAG: hypothetical protein E7051_10320 [Lentisphaerae bacterium]|nr:hypothetical protein [Lentisphaerota bacterium]